MAEHVVVIGAVALGPKAACRYKRLRPEGRVTMLDKGGIISYGGCGIPYYLSGDVSDIRELRTTSFKMVRDEKFFKETKDIEVRTRTEAVGIDRQAKRVLVKNLDTGEAGSLDYDKLVIATGASPRRLSLPGEHLPGIHAVADLNDAMAIQEAVAKGGAGKAVIIGAGFIGLEVAEALADMWGVETTVVEVMSHVLPRNVSVDLARMVESHLREKDVTLLFGERLLRFEGEGKVERVVTEGHTIEADLVILAAGVVPNSALARQAGLDVSARGGIVVDESLRTSDPDIFAGGDCVEIKNLVSGTPFFLPLGSMANRQGRVIGTNLAGGAAAFPGAVGSFAVKCFERSVAGAGFTVETATAAGFDALGVTAIQLDRAHFFPGKELLTLELTVDKKTRKILGIQGFGAAGDALVGRIGAVAGIMGFGATVDALSNLEYPYSPPFSSAMDVVNTLGNVADNMLAGLNRGLAPAAFERLFSEREAGACFFLDCREPDNATPLCERYPEFWHNIPQGKLRERLAEVPADKTVVLVCNTGGRSYEAQITLAAAGVTDVLNLHGGMAGLKQSGVEL